MNRVKYLERCEVKLMNFSLIKIAVTSLTPNIVKISQNKYKFRINLFVFWSGVWNGNADCFFTKTIFRVFVIFV